MIEHHRGFSPFITSVMKTAGGVGRIPRSFCSSGQAIVAAAQNEEHSYSSVAKALRHIIDHLEPPLARLVKRHDRILLKVNMGCSGARIPTHRFTTHPTLVEALIRLLQDCGASVSFGDDVSRGGKYCSQIWEATGMKDVAKRTGATLIDFVAVGAREVRGGLLYPRKYLVTNAYFEADVVINVANCRSQANIVMSGAVKNMFGCVLGKRKLLIHSIFSGNVRGFARTIADINAHIPAALSFLDLTSVVEGHGTNNAIRQVGLLLASVDPVALDTVAANAIGYDGLPIWTTYYGGKSMLGCNNPKKITIRGVDWNTFDKTRLKYPLLDPNKKPSLFEQIELGVNNTILRPRPKISATKCMGCGACAERCPIRCIKSFLNNLYRIDHRKCADCGCCLRVCEVGAVSLEFSGLAKVIRVLFHRLPQNSEPRKSNSSDPAPGGKYFALVRNVK